MDAEVKQRRDKANIYNESPAQGCIPAMLIWPHGACGGGVGICGHVEKRQEIITASEALGIFSRAP